MKETNPEIKRVIEWELNRRHIPLQNTVVPAAPARSAQQPAAPAPVATPAPQPRPGAVQKPQSAARPISQPATVVKQSTVSQSKPAEKPKTVASQLQLGLSIPPLIPLNVMKSSVSKTACDKTIADADNAFSILQKSTQDLRRTLEQLRQLSSFIPLLAPTETDKHCLEINCLESGPCIQFKLKDEILFTFDPGWSDPFATKNISNIWVLEKRGPDFILTHTDRLRIRISANKTLIIEGAKDAWNLKSNAPIFFRGDIEGSDFNFDCPNLTNTGTLAVKRLKTSGEFINLGVALQS